MLSSTEQLDGSTNSMDMSVNKLQEIVKEGKPGVLPSMGSQSWTCNNKKPCLGGGGVGAGNED